MQQAIGSRSRDAQCSNGSAGSNGDAVTLRFPEDSCHPNGICDYSLSLNGDAEITFTNSSYRYSLVDRLRGGSSVMVSKEPGNNDVADIACRSSNQSLQLNYTLRIMELSGVAGA